MEVDAAPAPSRKRARDEDNDSASTAGDAPEPKKARKSEPFRRVKAEEVEFINDRVKDNTYQAHDTYGAKAHRDLIVTKGKSFRAEKTKKKRGSYRGGQISTESNCIKLGSDSD
ncbi:SRP40, C-terminal domain-containing protein [Blastocladiella britannica]|nr:SRP40, C-terminal domain-containing protein [Blastocladiella britannica]